ncbi:unnamed protein product [Leuciscus chuanchicus]
MRRSDLRLSMSHEELMQGGYVVCEMHFEECFLVKHNGRATLTSDAIPKLVDCDNPPTLASPPLKRRKKTEAKQRQSEEQEEERDIIDTEGGTEKSTEETLETPVEIEERTEESTEGTDNGGTKEQAQVQVTIPLSSLQQKDQRIKQLEARLARLERLKRRKRKPTVRPKKPNPHEIMAEMLQRCPEGCRNFIQAQLSEAGKKDRGRRFDRNMKDLGLQLLHSSPKAYRQLKTIFALLNKNA